MSRDIRSFFVVKNPKSGQQVTLGKSTKTTQKPGQKKRPIIIDSDSDEESSPVNAKCSESSVEEVKKQNSHKKPKNEISEKKSKYFDCVNVSVEDIFRNTPVKRDTSRKIIKRVITKEDKESHFDKDFEAELLKIDDSWSDIIPVEEEFKKESCTSNAKETPKKTVFVGADNNNRKSPRKKKFELPSESPRKQFKSEDKEVSPNIKADKKIEIDKSPRNKKFYLNQGESPRKKFKSEDKEVSPNIKADKIDNDKFVRFNGCRRESPIKKCTTKLSPLNKGVSKSPIKSPYKKLSLTREKNEIFKNEFYTEVTVDVTHVKDTNISRKKRTQTDIISNKLLHERSPLKKRVEEAVRKIIDNRLEKKISSVVDEINDGTKPKKDSLPSVDAPSNLWVERYKPTATKQIIGQQGEKSCVNKLISWLRNWEKNHTGNKKLVKPSPWAKNDDGAFFKAALLSGPPGVGKTTTAHLVCRELGFDVVEFNASDTRSKRLLHEEVSELLSTNSLSPFFTGKGDQVTKKHVLLMDEVDGMAGNEDRGGVQELISLIKQSRIPVICMCNDRNHPKIRSLANYCYDLRFSKPRVEQIRGAMMSVCFKEKLKLKPDELTEIITSANQDIRLIMNHLSMLSMDKSSMANSTKHIKLGPWDIVRKIFSEQEHKAMSIYDKCDLFFHDYSITPLFVQENYLNAVPHKPEAKNKIKKMELFANAAKSLSFGDLTERSIRSNNAWGLLPVQAIFSSLVPGEVLEGHLGGQIGFPAWFGKNSRQTKMSRLIQELTVHSRLKISGNREAMNLDYLSSLDSAITSPMLYAGVDGVPAALTVLSEYCLVREDMESIADLSTWPGCQNRFAQVESKVKAAFTRAYNKTSAPTPYAAVPIKRGRGDVDLSEGLAEEDETGTQDMEDEEEEGLETDAMIMVKKKPAGKKADKDVHPSTSKGSKTSKRGRKK